MFFFYHIDEILFIVANHRLFVVFDSIEWFLQQYLAILVTLLTYLIIEHVFAEKETLG